MLSDHDNQDEVNIFKKIIYRREFEDPQYYKVVVHESYSDNPYYTLSWGSHEVQDSQGEKLPHMFLENVQLAHFPVRSIEQITVKIIISRLNALMRNAEIDSTDYSWHIRKLFKQIKDIGFITQEDLTEHSQNYAYRGTKPVSIVKDPLKTGCVLLYLRHQSIQPLRSIVNQFEKYILQMHHITENLEQKDKEILLIKNTVSWKITKPIRIIRGLFNKLLKIIST